MTFDDAAAFVLGTTGFGWLHVHYDYQSGSWVVMTDQTETTQQLLSGDLPSAQAEALERYGKTPVSGWVYAGNDEDGAKVVTV